MTKKELARALEKRTRTFAVQIIRRSSTLPKSSEAGVVRIQITKAGTSIGANYREANRSRSRADFRSRIRICESEASETQYWLEIIVDTGWLKWESVKPLYEERSEFLALFSSAAQKCTS